MLFSISKFTIGEHYINILLKNIPFGIIHHRNTFFMVAHIFGNAFGSCDKKYIFFKSQYMYVVFV